MQGKLILGATLLTVISPAYAGEPAKRPICTKEQPQQQRQQQPQQQRTKAQDCRAIKAIPPVVDPTPWFLL